MAVGKTCRCGRRVEAGARCVCGAGSQAERVMRQPWRLVYRLPSYKHNRMARYRLVGGRCEVCGVPLRGPLHDSGVAWECDHVNEARNFIGHLDDANAIENLRCKCEPCHDAKLGAKG